MWIVLSQANMSVSIKESNLILYLQLTVTLNSYLGISVKLLKFTIMNMILSLAQDSHLHTVLLDLACSPRNVESSAFLSQSRDMK